MADDIINQLTDGKAKETLKAFLPHYLSQKEEEKLIEDIKRFPKNMDSVFTISSEDDSIIYQGDGLVNLTVADMASQSFISGVKAMILSNTCDIDLNNKRPITPSICYTPIISLEKYKQLLLDNQQTNDFITGHIAAIKGQRVTNIIYIPKSIHNQIDEDSIVFLDRISHCSNDSIDRTQLKKNRLFRLSNYGFYLFLLKVSIHFTRMQEGLHRG